MRAQNICITLLSLSLGTNAMIQCVRERGNMVIEGKNGINTTLVEFMMAVTDQLHVHPYDHHIAQVEHDRKKDTFLDWTTDACTASLDKPFGFDFKSACVKHDFSHRNGKLLAAHDLDCYQRIIKPKFDRKFLEELLTACEQVESDTKKVLCEVTASVYARAGRDFARHVNPNATSDVWYMRKKEEDVIKAKIPFRA